MWSISEKTNKQRNKKNHQEIQALMASLLKAKRHGQISPLK